ncbi:MAG: hypothetical protein IPF51_16250 [Dehalococcoidia bacterium]|nr:hypothetical protein [Dehalococcoidia bacterium]
MASSLSLVGSCRQAADGACEAIVREKAPAQSGLSSPANAGPPKTVVEHVERESCINVEHSGDFHGRIER